MSLLNQKVLAYLPNADAYWVAFSGGMDSTVLLHLLTSIKDQLPGSLAAVHVNHQLQPDAEKWVQHCADVCKDLSIEYASLKVSVAQDNSVSLEAAARTARYTALKKWLPKKAVLITAHHQQDQAETLLLQLLRGAGPKGLASMPTVKEFANGALVRPLLSIAHTDLCLYAKENRLNWIEDPTNKNTSFDRNYLRHTIVPALKDKWPSADRVIARAAKHMAEACDLLTEVAESDFARCNIPGTKELSLLTIDSLSDIRQKNLFRYWISTRGYLMPSDIVLERVLTEIVASRVDANPLVCWSDVEIRRYRDAIYLQRQLPAFDRHAEHSWQPDQSPRLLLSHGALQAQDSDARGLSREIMSKTLQIRFRRGGEILKPANRNHRHTLKTLFQEWGVPVWLRDRWPLIYLEGEIIAIPGYCVAEGFQDNRADLSVVELSWNPNSLTD